MAQVFNGIEPKKQQETKQNIEFSKNVAMELFANFSFHEIADFYFELRQIIISHMELTAEDMEEEVAKRQKDIEELSNLINYIKTLN